ncbi:PLP-dependent transferase [Rhizopus microsporus ATCC 52813]|uniref:PLP-dependent transferase n=1 Tax=Rhizopus microsporus ATCC 52813 TaxID=1340429 RepID=A0A2G4SSI2_RHIZD|nr:PLP-dependent transferase [Rhizopus microsporus ATCC 52813]PHZ11356.1 PLP-dependent transferase [Rhizopus microsporus ATCC 52813]
MSVKPFGKQFRADFPLEDKYIPISHGAHGSYPAAVQAYVDEYNRRAEKHPDRWHRFDFRPLLQENLERAAALIKCDPRDIVFVANSSTGVNNILRSFPFEEGDKILCYQTTYINCDKTLEFLTHYKKVELVRVELNYPLEDDEVIRLTKEAIEREHAKDSSKKIRLGFFDAISSLPGVCMPYQALTKLFREYDILSFVDGAHAIGHIELNLAELDPDFFVSNCHKWLFTPRGCAVLYVSKRYQGWIHPPTINYAYQHHDDPTDGSSFNEEHVPGVTNITSYLCIGPALDYRESIGGEEAIRKYTHELAVQGGELVANMLGTQVMENSTKTLTASMVNVELPIKNTTKTDQEITSFFMKKSIYEYNTIIVVYKNNSKWWARLCGQIYIDLDDFKAAGEIILKIIKELEQA